MSGEVVADPLPLGLVHSPVHFLPCVYQFTYMTPAIGFLHLRSFVNLHCLGIIVCFPCGTVIGRLEFDIIEQESVVYCFSLPKLCHKVVL